VKSYLSYVGPWFNPQHYKRENEEKKLKLNKNKPLGWGCSLVIEHLPSMFKDLV
jgi:hypothetical protein